MMSRRQPRSVTVPVSGTALFLIDVILRGIAGNIFVLFTANDAYMRDLKIYAPSDCIVSNIAEENAQALKQIGSVLKGNLTASPVLRFQKHRLRRQ